jgi:hypothetical protein
VRKSALLIPRRKRISGPETFDGKSLTQHDCFSCLRVGCLLSAVQAWVKSGAADSGGKGSVIIRGMPISGNVIPAVLLAKTLGVGDMEMMNIMEGAQMTPEMLKINPWHRACPRGGLEAP